MPELPDLTAYIESLEERIVGHPLNRIRIKNPFLLRTYDPPTASLQGKKAININRIGKYIVVGFEDDLFLVFHLMILGRFLWKNRGAGIPARHGLAAFDFTTGTLLMVEYSSKKRASLHIVQGNEALLEFKRGGVEILDIDRKSFSRAIKRENHTLKRALTDPRIIAGIGNAYSDEILHRAGLSPLKLSSSLSDENLGRLYQACRETLVEWTDRLRKERSGDFPQKVTAFREKMAVHGRFGKPCPTCGSPVQRIVYSENECNYCPICQTGGKILVDRALSRILKRDWPRTLDELEELQSRMVSPPSDIDN
jgi:formamidopyrimidine-DNA glycosylase